MLDSPSEIIPNRYSCRSYTSQPIEKQEQIALRQYLLENTEGPLGTHTRFDLIAATEQDRQSLKGLGTYGFIKNPAGFIIGAIQNGIHDLEDYGFLLERIILFSTHLGLGTCWLGGSFSKSSFAKKIVLQENETMPAVASIGYAVKTIKDTDRLRKSAGSDRRLPFGTLFFEKSFETSIPSTSPARMLHLLTMVRLAPSASNKQPWRIVHQDAQWHFYLQRTKGYGKGTLIYSLLRLADLQRVDMGIAMCHFQLAAEELGIRGQWVVHDPQIQTPAETEYTATFQQH